MARPDTGNKLFAIVLFRPLAVVPRKCALGFGRRCQEDRHIARKKVLPTTHVAAPSHKESGLNPDQFSFRFGHTNNHFTSPCFKEFKTVLLARPFPKVARIVTEWHDMHDHTIHG